MLLIRDHLTLDASGLALTKDGYLVGDAKVARAGNVQQYYGYEIGLTGDQAAQMFGVYRDPEVVFSWDSMLSLAGRPVTRGHPPEGVTSESWKDLAVGQMGGAMVRDGEYVVAPMAIMDSKAVQEVAAGARSLSAGYTATIIADEGVAADGTPYQYRQAGPLRFNHVAYLPDNNPRAGNTRIGDRRDPEPQQDLFTPSTERTTTMAEHATLKAVMVDGISIQVTDQGAQAIEKLQKQLADAKTAADTAAAKHTADVAAKDTEIGKLTADLKTAKDAIPDAAAIDKLVADRVTVIAAARTIDKDIKVEGVSNADIRKAAVAKKMGDEAVKDASEATVTGMFLALTKDAKPATGADPLRAAIITGPHADSDGTKTVNDAYAQMVKDMHSAHLPKTAA